MSSMLMGYTLKKTMFEKYVYANGVHIFGNVKHLLTYHSSWFISKPVSMPHFVYCLSLVHKYLYLIHMCRKFIF
jgi:hypothetical protein